jgi:hypothetical protein
LASPHAALRPESEKPTFHSESDRDAIDHVKIIDGMGTSHQLSERQQVDSLLNFKGFFSFEGAGIFSL